MNTTHGMDAPQRGMSADRPFSLGVLFVHGIGTQPRGDTLASFGGAFYDWLQIRCDGLAQSERSNLVEGWQQKLEAVDWADATKCKHCGSSLVTPPPMTPEELQPCPDCGHQVSPSAAACPGCGRRITASSIRSHDHAYHGRSVRLRRSYPDNRRADHRDRALNSCKFVARHWQSTRSTLICDLFLRRLFS
jgi:double zinc ribbon protein